MGGESGGLCAGRALPLLGRCCVTGQDWPSRACVLAEPLQDPPFPESLLRSSAGHTALPAGSRSLAEPAEGNVC